MRNGKVLHEDGLWPADGDWKKVHVSDMIDDGGSIIDEFEVNIGRWVDPTHAPDRDNLQRPKPSAATRL